MTEPEIGGQIEDALDLSTWHGPDQMQTDAARLGARFAEALAEETADHRTLRDKLLPALGEIKDVVRARGAGVYAATPRQLARVQQSLLANGAAATGATSAALEVPRLGVAQVGVCLLRYDGRPGATIGTRFYRRDVPLPSDPMEQAYRLLDRQSGRQLEEETQPEGGIAELARRGVQAFAERAILLHDADTPWRIGSGPFAPYELLTGSGRPEVLRRGLAMLRAFVDTCPHFAFAATPGRERVMEVLGGGLRPGEFALVQNDHARCDRIVEQGNLRGGDRALAQAFVAEVAPRITQGVCRVSRFAPPQVFWAHEDHARSAALILMAEAARRAYTNRPLLPDLARANAKSAFATEGIEASLITARARQSRPFG